MPKAVLFDLDNTLILYEEQKFLQVYFASLAGAFSDIIPPDSLPERVLMSTIALSSNDGTLSNADYFMNTFLDPGSDRVAVWNRFLEFYHNEYRSLLPEVRIPEGIETLLQKLRDRNIKIVLATNPIYPRAAYAHRLTWAGLTLGDFDVITDIQNSHFVKPNAGYFTAIAESLSLPASSCLMVGNDPVYDVAAKAVGMQTYLTEDAREADYILPGIPTSDPTFEPDHAGPLSDLVASGILAG